jgi:hypothetical protein
VVEEARLESVYTGNRIEGSNPSVSAPITNDLAINQLFTLLFYQNGSKKASNFVRFQCSAL